MRASTPPGVYPNVVLFDSGNPNQYAAHSALTVICGFDTDMSDQMAGKMSRRRPLGDAGTAAR
jgi:hypothetical protein